MLNFICITFKQENIYEGKINIVSEKIITELSYKITLNRNYIYRYNCEILNNILQSNIWT